MLVGFVMAGAAVGGALAVGAAPAATGTTPTSSATGATPPGAPGTTGAGGAPSLSDVREAVHWALAHETRPKNLEAFARALVEWGGDPNAANALLLRAVQIADPHAGKL